MLIMITDYNQEPQTLLRARQYTVHISRHTIPYH